MDYSKSLNLPTTNFPMRANLPQNEPDIIKFWEENKIYEKTLDKKDSKGSFILHDGPPYANGDIHVGHALNKVLKDIVIKFQSMQGYRSPYIPGWDTHGLPIELQAIKNLGLDRSNVGPVEFRTKCKEYALGFIDKQREQFKRLGIRGDWSNPYLTLNPEFEAKQIEVFGEMSKKGYIYKGLKPVYWCPCCETALAEAEIEYGDHYADSVYVKFRVIDDKGVFSPFVSELDKVFAVIWTTTVWTLPANLAICLGPEIEYSLVQFGNENYLVASDLVEKFAKTIQKDGYNVISKFKATELENIITKHPFYDRNSPIILGEHVTLEQGTGCVHTAPGHGQEDFDIGKKYYLEVLNPVDDRGHMTDLAGKYEGLYYQKANKVILEDMRESGVLLAEERVIHSYPHCWRCKDPVIFRATEQWFASIDGFRQKALEEIKNVKWGPAWGEDRMTNMVQDRYDWCISRQRIWGVPIPVFYCCDCGKEIINDITINAVSQLFKDRGSDAWFELSAEEILPQGVKCECGSSGFTKETDIMDVWFDSGSSHAAVLDITAGLSCPADMYLEGNDQYRGWFQSSLLTSVATRGSAPYKTVLTHGFVVDGEGKKMSKSLGNVIDPLEVINQYGADILRLWVISADYKADMRISQSMLKQMSEVYRKIRNTFRFLLGNLDDYNPDKDSVKYEDLLEIDKWAMMKLQQLIKRVTTAYNEYEYHVVYHSIHNFCVVEMSNFYLDIIKDRLYTEKPFSKERRAAQTVLYDVLTSLVSLLTPVLTFTAEEIWKYMPKKKLMTEISPQLISLPDANDNYIKKELDDKWKMMIAIRSEISKALEDARNKKVIGHSLKSKVTIYASDELFGFLKGFNEKLSTVFIVSETELINSKPTDFNMDGLYVSEAFEDFYVLVSQAPGEKCERCWTYSTTIGEVPEHKTICKRCANNLAE